jgi:hypothetical protein
LINKKRDQQIQPQLDEKAVKRVGSSRPFIALASVGPRQMNQLKIFAMRLTFEGPSDANNANRLPASDDILLIFIDPLTGDAMRL